MRQHYTPNIHKFCGGAKTASKAQQREKRGNSSGGKWEKGRCFLWQQQRIKGANFFFWFPVRTQGFSNMSPRWHLTARERTFPRKTTGRPEEQSKSSRRQNWKIARPKVREKVAGRANQLNILQFSDETVCSNRGRNSGQGRPGGPGVEIRNFEIGLLKRQNIRWEEKKKEKQK